MLHGTQWAHGRWRHWGVSWETTWQGFCRGNWNLGYRENVGLDDVWPLFHIDDFSMMRKPVLHNFPRALWTQDRWTGKAMWAVGGREAKMGQPQTAWRKTIPTTIHWILKLDYLTLGSWENKLVGNADPGWIIFKAMFMKTFLGGTLIWDKLIYYKCNCSSQLSL